MDIQQRWRKLLAGLSLLLLAATTHAQQQGPDPTSTSLNGAGTFAVTSIEVSNFSTPGFGAATIYYPTQAGSYAGIAICPGFTATRSSIAWLAQRLASFGFVTIAINTNSTFDQPSSRATQLVAALNYLVNSSPTAARSRVDRNRLGVAGHSMGGGGSIQAARDNPSLRAAIPLTPWHSTKSWSTVRVPTIIVGAENDSIAPVGSHSIPFYTSLPSTLDKAYAELNGEDHFAPNSTNTPINRYSVAWAKRFLDTDLRYDPFLCGAPHQAFATASVFSDYRSTCPY
jgi:predicted dienelactone hydrolase